MVCWRIPPGTYRAALASFLETGAPCPDGLKSVGRWHAPGSMRGWHLVEGEPVAVATLAAQWAHLLELEVTPVIEDAGAAEAASKVYSK